MDVALKQFLALLRAGLWEQSAGIASDEPMDFKALYRLAEEQSALGLVAAGLEHLEGRVVPPSELRDFLETVMYLDKRNVSMDAFVGGLGLRQICDWCRLLWTYRDSIDRGRLEDLVRQSDLVSEWKAFGAFAVDNLGLPAEAMPLYDASAKWQRKARRIHSFIMETGNFGHNRDKSYYSKYPYLVYKAISLWGHIRDFFKRLMIFPMDSLRVFGLTLVGGVKAVAEGK